MAAAARAGGDLVDGVADRIAGRVGRLLHSPARGLGDLAGRVGHRLDRILRDLDRDAGPGAGRKARQDRSLRAGAATGEAARCIGAASPTSRRGASLDLPALAASWRWLRAACSPIPAPRPAITIVAAAIVIFAQPVAAGSSPAASCAMAAPPPPPRRRRNG